MPSTKERLEKSTQGHCSAFSSTLASHAATSSLPAHFSALSSAQVRLHNLSLSVSQSLALATQSASPPTSTSPPHRCSTILSLRASAFPAQSRAQKSSASLNFYSTSSTQSYFSTASSMSEHLSSPTHYLRLAFSRQ